MILNILYSACFIQVLSTVHPSTQTQLLRVTVDLLLPQFAMTKEYDYGWSH